MKKNSILKIVNACTAAVFLLVMATAALATLGVLAADDLHRYAGYALVIAIAVHLALNWTWVKSSYFKISKERT